MVNSPFASHRNDAIRRPQYDRAMSIARRSIILDCDPGHDDALAMVLALARPELRLLGITTVGGNSTLENTTRNALSVLTLLGRTDVPVAAGAVGPLTRRLETAPGVHGTSGLDGADLPAPQMPVVDDDAVEFIARGVSRTREPVTLVPTGPLTNIALFRRRYPELYARVAEVVLMGGSLVEGNITPFAEFNICVVSTIPLGPRIVAVADAVRGDGPRPALPARAIALTRRGWLMRLRGSEFDSDLVPMVLGELKRDTQGVPPIVALPPIALLEPEFAAVG